MAFNWELAFLASKIPHFKIRINFGQMCGQLVVVILIFCSVVSWPVSILMLESIDLNLIENRPDKNFHDKIS